MSSALPLRRAAALAAALVAVHALGAADARADATAPEQPLPAAPDAAPLGVSLSLSNSLVLRGRGDQTSLLGALSGSYAWNGWLTTFARVGWVHDAPSGATSANALANPAAGLSLQLPVSKRLTLGGSLGATAPLGSGGGDRPNPAAMKAWVSSFDWGGATFAVNHVDVFGGARADYTVGPVTLQLESTLHQLTRVRGETVDPIGAAVTMTGSQATIAYTILPNVTLSTAMYESRVWNTPTCIRESPDSRADYFVMAGATLDLRIRGLAIAPGFVYARALDLPLVREKFQVVELDLGVAL